VLTSRSAVRRLSGGGVRAQPAGWCGVAACIWRSAIGDDTTPALRATPPRWGGEECWPRAPLFPASQEAGCGRSPRGGVGWQHAYDAAPSATIPPRPFGPPLLA